MWSTAAFGISASVMPVEYGVITAGCLLLERFIAFDAFFVLVAGFAFLDDDLGAADAAVARIQHGHVVMHAVGDRDARIRERTGAVGEQRYERIRGSLRNQGGSADQARNGRAEDRNVLSALCFSLVHLPVLCCPGVYVRPSIEEGHPQSGAYGPDRGIGPSVPFQYGKGHTLSFCFPICQSRAKPFGSTIRKKMMSTPSVMKLMCSTFAEVIGMTEGVLDHAQHDGQPVDQRGAEDTSRAGCRARR